MKTKLAKILGIGFTLVLVASMMLFAIPVQADPYQPLHPTLPNMWQGFPPTPGALGLWFFDPAISQVGPNAQAINGDFYTYVAGTAATPNNPGTNDIFKSVDGGRTWTVSAIPFYYGGGPVVDMVCSSMSEDVLYLTDGNYVYRSINGAATFTLVAAEDLETELTGTCGTPITLLPITCIDLAYDGDGMPIVFIGTRDVGEYYDDADQYAIVGSVYWIADQTFSADWRDLQLRCYGCCDWPVASPSSCVGCYDVYSVAAAPGFATVSKAYAVVSAPLTGITFTAATAATVEIRAGDYGAEFDWVSTGVTGLSGTAGITDNTTGTNTMAAASPNTVETLIFTPGTAGTVHITMVDGTISWRVLSGSGVTFCGGTYVVSTLGTVCAWSTVTELKWNCLWSFAIEHASRIKFPSYYGTDPTLFVGVAAVNDTSGQGTYDGFGEGGDVYRVADTFPPSGCIDLNVQGFTTGCTGLHHANIQSLDICNDALTAGARNSYQLQSPVRVYYSADGGWTWTPSLKDPTGTYNVYVLFDQATCDIHAGSTGCNAAWSLSCGANPGQFFNQISLIDMNIAAVLDMTHAPGYVLDSQTMYVLVEDPGCEPGPNDICLLRWDGTFWERVYTNDIYYALGQVWLNDPLYEWVEVSPDFNSTSCLYMGNSAFYMTRSIDAGCSWAPIIYPCYDRPTISAWIIVDEDTVLAAGCDGFAGHVYRTINHGSQPWSDFLVPAFPSGYATDGVDFDLSLPRGADSDVLLGDDSGQVFLSQDLGATWVEIEDAVTGLFGFYSDNSLQTYVVFDPGYGTADDPGENMIYAAAGDEVGRCNLNLAGALPFKQDWVYISNTTALTTCDPFLMYEASGIDAAGDTALYVSDAGYSTSGITTTYAEGTMGVRYACDPTPTLCTCDLEVPSSLVTVLDGAFQLGEPLNVISYDLECQWDGDVEGILTFQGFLSGAMGTITINLDSEMDECFLCTVDGGAVEFLYGNLTITAAPTSGVDYPTGVWRTLNPMDWMAPVDPFDKVEWEFMQDSGNSFRHVETDNCGINPDDLWLTLTASSNVLWCLDDEEGESPTSYIWIWDDPLARPVIQIQPADGALLATTTTATIEWEALDAALLYEVFVYSWCEACPNNMVVFDDFTTNLTCYTLEGLTPGLTYYWMVRVACDHPLVSKWSTLRSFDTALGTVPYLCAPWCGQDDVIITTNFAWDAVVGATSYEVQIATDEAFSNIVASGTTTVNAFTPAAALDYSTVYFWRVRAVKDGVYGAWAVCIFTTAAEPAEPVEPPPAVVITQEEITPTWIWVIIGIGGALTIAVVILIVTTRRVP